MQKKKFDFVPTNIFVCKNHSVDSEQQALQTELTFKLAKTKINILTVLHESRKLRCRQQYQVLLS